MAAHRACNPARLAVTTLVLCMAGTTHAGVTPLAVDYTTNFLYDVDLSTGGVNNPRPLDGYRISGIDYGPGGTLYALGQGPNLTDPSFFRIDVATGELTRIGSLGVNYHIGALAYDEQTGVMYGSQIPVSGLGAIFTIDLATGAATVFQPSIAAGAAIAFDGDGRLWVLDSQYDFLWELDPDTGASINAMALPYDVSVLTRMDFDPTSGKMYVFEGADTAPVNQPSDLYTIDLATGALTHVGATASQFDPMGFTVPEPAAALLIAPAFLAWRRSRTR